MKDSAVSSRRPRSSPAERAQWVERFAQSGLSVNEFALQEGLKFSTLQRWLYEHRAKQASPTTATEQSPAPSGFHELRLPSLSRRWAAEVLRADGSLIRLAHDAPVQWLQLLLASC